MMRNKPSSSLQKTYDECYLICSTAIYFEGQSNEAEALRSWRNALDQIHYHNAYRVPANYRPKTETEKALQESLREMEMQCKERVDLLEALHLSRLDSKSGTESLLAGSSANKARLMPAPRGSLELNRETIGEGTVPAFNYPDLSRPAPPLPQRPIASSKKSSGQDIPRAEALAQLNGSSSKPYSPPSLPVPQKKESHSPSPEKKTALRMTLRSGKDGKKSSQSSKNLGQRRESGIAAAKAATQAWGSISRYGGERPEPDSGDIPGVSTVFNSARRQSYEGAPNGRSDSLGRIDYDHEGSPSYPGGSNNGPLLPPSPWEYMPQRVAMRDRMPQPYGFPFRSNQQNLSRNETPPQSHSMDDLTSLDSPTGAFAQHRSTDKLPIISKSRTRSPIRQPNHFRPPQCSSQYRDSTNNSKKLPLTPGIRRPRPNETTAYGSLPYRSRSPRRNSDLIDSSTGVSRWKNQLDMPSPQRNHQPSQDAINSTSSGSGDEGPCHSAGESDKLRRNRRGQSEDPILAEFPTTPNSALTDSPTTPTTKAWDDKILHVMKHLPKGVDEAAAKQIFNEIVVKGDEVHWDDVAGLDSVKLALKEAVVYPFLRPDLFMGLREPARGMLLFGPPGTGKTMLARAVATESRSTFFSISASSLTSKYLGESEKLVRALFQLAKALAPSIIFVDEIDSLLSSRSGSGEHEATRRIKTEFLIQWSDLQRAAAGREQTNADKEKGDASRVLVLAATNLPWAIDEAARRRFVRRQYIPLPEGHTRAVQLRTLLGHQKHGLTSDDIEKLVDLTEGFSGSDITALAKDAAMGPLRSLGEAVLQMSMDQISPIKFEDFKASLVNIRPSVSKQGLKQFEDWAREFGERGA